ncbi:TPA: hypothetical protein N0F65_004593 [Lagenidium giganteum]|uniref:Uncharacterized protein n=1 Tax=Lagenidium giganteum TaxID=4803 RepID=A0AAV2ZFT5_9STRA|nr:TPA: hypothetical protein N0F65_004593 [Lagenidium giganteum]
MTTSLSPTTLKRRKKYAARSVVSRHMFSLPALPHFEPVLSSSPRLYMRHEGESEVISSAIDHAALINNNNNTVMVIPVGPLGPTASATMSTPTQPQRPRSRDRQQPVASPRTRLTASPSAAQRLAIRPLFEQRRAEEASVARSILAQRDDAQRQAAHKATAAEHMWSSAPVRVGESGSEGHQPEADREALLGAQNGRLDLGELAEFTDVRFFTRPSSAESRDLKHVVDSVPLDEPDALPQAPEDLPTIVDAIKADEDRLSEVYEPQTTVVLPPLTEKTFHVPFLNVLTLSPELIDTLDQRSDIDCSPPVTPTPSTPPPHSVPTLVIAKLTTPTPALVESMELSEPELPPTPAPARYQLPTSCYKVLWRESRHVDGEALAVSVLLSSHGHVEVLYRSTNEEDTTKSYRKKMIVGANDIEATRKWRGDLQPYTARWAEWLVTRLRFNAMGQMKLLLQDDAAAATSVYVRIVTLPTGVDACVHMRWFPSAANDSVSITSNDAQPPTSSPRCDGTLIVDTEVLGSNERNVVRLSVEEVRALARSIGLLSDSDDHGSIGHLLESEDSLHSLLTETKLLALLPKIETIPSEDAAAATDADAIADAEDDEENAVHGPPVLASFDDVCDLAQRVTVESIIPALQWFQRGAAVDACVQTYLTEAARTFHSEDAKKVVTAKIERAKQAKLEELAILALIDTMVVEILAFECRAELEHAKYSGGFDDYYASKVQATFRMSAQRRQYEHRRRVRVRAARLLQALQRGIAARCRFAEMKMEREKYLYYGFRSSLHHATAHIEDPKQRALELTQETEQRRHNFLMQVLHGYAVKHGLSGPPFRFSPDVVVTILNDYGVVVGCPPTLGTDVLTLLVQAQTDGNHHRPTVVARRGSSVVPMLYSSIQVSAALLLALRSQYDDTFGLSVQTRTLQVATVAPRRGSVSATDVVAIPPRWLLKLSAPFQRANKNRLAALRLARQRLGHQAAHLVALEYRRYLNQSVNTFEACRKQWEEHLQSQQARTQWLAQLDVPDLLQYTLDLLISSIKDWGIDQEPLFQALNTCLVHPRGREVIGLLETKFNTFATGVNELQGKRSVLTLRHEIEAELEEFEKLLAVRCLNMARDQVVATPPSEILHVVLHGTIDVEYVRHALPTVLPVASVNDKYVLAKTLITAYANEAYGAAFLSVCTSCLDVAENMTVEAAQFIEKITRHDPTQRREPIEQTDENNGDSITGMPRPLSSSSLQDRKQLKETVTRRALFLLTGAQSVQFLVFLAKAAQFNKAIQRHVLEHLAPYAAQYEMHRLASAVCALTLPSDLDELFTAQFQRQVVYGHAKLWTQYQVLFGRELMQAAQASGVVPMKHADVAASTRHLQTRDREPSSDLT